MVSKELNGKLRTEGWVSVRRKVCVGGCGRVAAGDKMGRKDITGKEWHVLLGKDKDWFWKLFIQ